MSSSPPSTGKRKRPTTTTTDAVINPLSHSTKTLAQFAPAGYSPDLPIPSTLHPNFPHRPLPRSPSPSRHPRRAAAPKKPAPTTTTTTDPSDGDDEGDPAPTPDPDPGSAPNRTTRAHVARVGALTAAIHALLGRSDVAGARRAFGLLVRARVYGGARLDLRRDRMWEVGTEILMRSSSGEKERGGVATYYAALAREYPFSRAYPGSVSAVEFWPAMFGVEMEGVWEGMVGGLGEVGDGDGEGEGDEWRVREEERVRREALGKMRELAGRMDDVMDARPFSADHEMLRLRAMVALYVGDLAVGAGVGEDGEEGDGGVRERAEAIAKARRLFRTLKKTGGEIKEEWIERLIEGDDEDEEVEG
ncbi:RNA polymerase I-specific transcription initiation factor rrn11 [Podospora conica]|nr:RNA polymerase I-specific transcription initiation factor rrn11 [Schizothecium conicum]